MEKDHIENVCKLGEGHDCCRYLIIGSDGFQCAKQRTLRSTLDEKVANKLIIRGHKIDICGIV